MRLDWDIHLTDDADDFIHVCILFQLSINDGTLSNVLNTGHRSLYPSSTMLEQKTDRRMRSQLTGIFVGLVSSSISVVVAREQLMSVVVEVGSNVWW